MSDRLPADVHSRARVTEETNYRILNSAEGVRNYVPKQDLFKYIEKVFGQIAVNLSDHCGPFSRSALIVSPSGGKFETNVFTRDGKDIVANMNFVSPIEEIIKQMLLYIGARIDNKAGDGTTSSMYLASRFFDIIAKEYKNKIVNSRVFARDYEKFNDILKEELSKQKITVDELMDYAYPNKKAFTVQEYQKVVATIAAFQALSSSNGDQKLADAMYQIYLQSPPGTWDYVSVFHNKYENSDAFSVDVDNYDFTLDAQIQTTTQLNHNLYTEYLDTVDLLIIPEEIPDSGFFFDKVLNYLKEVTADTERTRPLVIICRKMGSIIERWVVKFNDEHDNFKIVVFDHMDKMSMSGKSTMLIALALSGGIEPYISSAGNLSNITDQHVIHGARVHFKNHKFHVEYDPTEKKLSTDIANKYYDDPELFPPYTYFLKILNTRLQRLKDDIQQSNFHNEIEYYQEIIARMTFPRRPYLMVGGTAHDHAEAVAVVRDVCGAINSSLTYGFVCGSSFALLRAIRRACSNTPFMRAVARATIELIAITASGTKESLEQYRDADNTNIWKIHKEQFNKVYYWGTEEYNQSDYKKEKETDEPCEIDLPSGKFMYMNMLEKNINHNEFKERSLIDWLLKVVYDSRMLREDSILKQYPVIQPSAVFEHLFYRIGEVMIKLITTECAIVPNAVFIDKDE